MLHRDQAGLMLVDLTSHRSTSRHWSRRSSNSRSRPTIVAFGPHVHEPMLNAAEAAGCDAGAQPRAILRRYAILYSPRPPASTEAVDARPVPINSASHRVPRYAGSRGSTSGTPVTWSSANGGMPNSGSSST